MTKVIPTSLLNRIKPPPQAAIDALLSRIPRDLLLDPSTRVADLAMGGGHFLHAVYKMRLDSGLDPVTASKNLFGFESNSVFVRYAAWKAGLPESCVTKLKLEDLDRLDMKFDVIIGNPPYSLPKKEGMKLSNGTKNLALQFIEKGVELLNPGGYISMLTPMNFLKPTNSSGPTVRFKSMKGLSLLSVKTGVESWFRVGTKIGLWSAVKGEFNPQFKLNGLDWNLEEVPFAPSIDDPVTLNLFRKVWTSLFQGEGDSLETKQISGDKLPESGWCCTERVNRNREKTWELRWCAEPQKEKLDQIHINLSVEKATELFSQLHMRFITKATFIEPTFYHNLYRNMKVKTPTLSSPEVEVIENFLSKK